jgi:hypothetical protein
MCVIVEPVSVAPGLSSIPAVPTSKSQVRIEGDNKIYERDADSGFKISLPQLPNVAAAFLRCTRTRLLGRASWPLRSLVRRQCLHRSEFLNLFDDRRPNAIADFHRYLFIQRRAEDRGS